MIVEAIKSAIPLKTYLAEHGAEFVRNKACCPFHEERTPSGSLYSGQDGHERYKCFGCGIDVDVIGAAQEFYGLDFKGALSTLADRVGLKLEGQTSTAARAAQMEHEERRRLIGAFRAWEQQAVDDISAVLRAYRHMRVLKTAFTEAELIALAELQGEMDILKFYYEILCKRDDEAKYLLFREVMSYAV